MLSGSFFSLKFYKKGSQTQISQQPQSWQQNLSPWKKRSDKTVTPEIFLEMYPVNSELLKIRLQKLVFTAVSFRNDKLQRTFYVPEIFPRNQDVNFIASNADENLRGLCAWKSICAGINVLVCFLRLLLSGIGNVVETSGWSVVCVKSTMLV